MFIILEIQANRDETASTLVDVFKESEQDIAESKYHEKLMYAAVSSVYRHAVSILKEDGSLIRSECYIHENEAESEATE